ncbi:hypothetical protein ACLK19_18365 [Escherichia coli]
MGWKMGAGSYRRGGELQVISIIASSAPVHPRWRGEHQRIESKCRYAAAYTPAGAEALHEAREQRSLRGGYPRWRGERAAHGEHMKVCLPGLSPLARGTRARCS